MKFYRVCHSVEKTGGYHRGPYSWRYPELASGMGEAHSHNPTHPGIRQEFGQYYDHCVCGFDSMDQLHAWFAPEWLEAMAEAGFVLRVFELPATHMIAGEYQCLAEIRAVERAQDEAEVRDLFELVPA